MLKNKDNWYIIIGVILFFIIIPFLLFYDSKISDYYESEGMFIVKGICTEKIYDYNQHSGNRRIIKYQFHLDGSIFKNDEIVSTLMFDSINNGDSLLIYYSPIDPKYNYLKYFSK